jgi:hypothetical protein
MAVILLVMLTGCSPFADPDFPHDQLRLFNVSLNSVRLSVPCLTTFGLGVWEKGRLTMSRGTSGPGHCMMSWIFEAGSPYGIMALLGHGGCHVLDFCWAMISGPERAFARQI